MERLIANFYDSQSLCFMQKDHYQIRYKLPLTLFTLLLNSYNISRLLPINLKICERGNFREFIISTVQWMDSLLWLWCSPWCLIGDIWWGELTAETWTLTMMIVTVTRPGAGHCSLLGAITLRRNQSRDFYTWREKRYSPAYIRQSANQRAGLWFRPMRAQGSQRPKPTGRATSTSGHLRPSHFSQPKHNTLGGQIQNWSVSTLWARQRDLMIGGWNRDIGVVCCI